MVKTEGFISPVSMTFRICELLSSKQGTGRSNSPAFIHTVDWRCKKNEGTQSRGEQLPLWVRFPRVLPR